MAPISDWMTGVIESLTGLSTVDIVWRVLLPVFTALISYLCSVAYRNREKLLEPLLGNGESPAETIRETFERIRCVEKRLIALQFSQRADSDTLFLVCFLLFWIYVPWGICLYIGKLGLLPLTLAYLVVSGLGMAIVACSHRPMSSLGVLVGVLSFPFYGIYLVFRGQIDSRRSKVVAECRWMLLYAIPSNRRAQIAIARRHEHLAALRTAHTCLSKLERDAEVALEVREALLELRAIEKTMMEWPSACDVFQQLGIKELCQETIPQKIGRAHV